MKSKKKKNASEMTDRSGLDNWEDNDAIIINKGLRQRGRLVGKQRLGDGDS